MQPLRRGDRHGARLGAAAFPAWLGTRGPFAAAEGLFAQAVLLAPDFHLARYQLGLLQFSGGRAQLALLTWAPLLEWPASEPFPHLVRAFSALASDDLDGAKALFGQALPLARDNEGMVADIERLMQAIDESTARSAPAAPEGEAPAHHVLLGNYSRSIH